MKLFLALATTMSAFSTIFILWIHDTGFTTCQTMIARIFDGNTVIKNGMILKEPILFVNFVRNRHHEKIRKVKNRALTWRILQLYDFWGQKSGRRGSDVTDWATSISCDNMEGREGLIGLQEKKERDLYKYMQVRSCDLATPSYTPKGVYMEYIEIYKMIVLTP